MTPTALGSAPIRMLDAQHDEYVKQYVHWENIGLLYRGGRDLVNAITRFLSRRPQEPQDEYMYRVSKFVYLNLISSIGWYGARIFKGIPQLVVTKKTANGQPGAQIDGKDAQFYQDFVVNCDRAGTPLHRFFNDVFVDGMLYKRAWFAVDKPNIGDVSTMSLQQYRDAGGDQPYLCRMDPLTVIDWSIDEDGALDYVVVKQISTQKGFLQKPVRYANWYVYDRTMFRHYRAKLADDGNTEGNTADLVNSGPHALALEGRVPFQRLEFPDALWLGDRAYLPCVSHLNKTNELDFGLSMGCLIMPVYASDSDLTPKIGESSIIKLRQGDTFGWTEPKGDVFRIAMEANRELREYIFSALYLAHQGRDSRTAPSVRSGAAFQEDARPANEILEAFGGMLAQTINAAMVDVTDARDEDFQIELKGWDFVVEISSDRLNKIIKVLDLALGSVTLEKELKIEIALDAIPQASESVRQAVSQEIKDAPTDEEKADQARLDALAAADAQEKTGESDTDATP